VASHNQEMMELLGESSARKWGKDKTLNYACADHSVGDSCTTRAGAGKTLSGE
jgi:hypothetical protein